MSKWLVTTYYDGKRDPWLRGTDPPAFDTKLQAQAFRNDEQDWDLANLGEEEAARYTYVIEDVDD